MEHPAAGCRNHFRCPVGGCGHSLAIHPIFGWSLGIMYCSTARSSRIEIRFLPEPSVGIRTWRAQIALLRSGPSGTAPAHIGKLFNATRRTFCYLVRSGRKGDVSVSCFCAYPHIRGCRLLGAHRLSFTCTATYNGNAESPIQW